MEDPTRDSFALKMYSQRKGSVDITPSEPQFMAQYVGKTEVFLASGKGCTENAVQKIWDNCYDERGMRRVSVLINCSGLVMRDIDGRMRDVVVDIKDIAYCCAERGPHDRVFAWISKDPLSKKLECHAVLCSAKERAQLMALTLHQAFHIAYKDWKLSREKRAKTKSSISKQQNGHLESRNGIGSRKVSSSSTSQDSGSISEESEGSSDGVNTLMETLMAQMNIVEEEEISMTDDSIVIGTK